MNAGEFANLQCIVPTGDLPLNIRWSYPGEEMGGSSGVLAKKVADRVSMLMISVITARHAGEYVCTAENAAGTSSHSTILTVNGSGLHDLFLENTAFSFHSSVAFCHLSSRPCTQTQQAPPALLLRFLYLFLHQCYCISRPSRSSRTHQRIDDDGIMDEWSIDAYIGVY